MIDNSHSNGFIPFSLNLHGRLYECARPQVMGIINVTPDSFYPGSRVCDSDSIKRRVAQMIEQGVDMIDVGAYSSRPGADEVSELEEIQRLELGLHAIRSVAPDIPVSVDTFRAEVACRAIMHMGGDIINDISGLTLDSKMIDVVAQTGAPYILMHMRGNPATMQTLTDYDDVVTDVAAELSKQVVKLRERGVKDIILDPGIGFAKTVDDNFRLLSAVNHFVKMFDLPVLIGISRKSLITKTLNISPSEALNGTTVLNTIALLNGASIIRVHDVREARQAVDLVTKKYN